MLSNAMDLRLGELPVAVVDVETTGFGVEHHRILEVAVVHLEPETGPQLVFDSLVRPDRRVGNREIHGINNRDVRKAPRIDQIAGSVCDALVGRWVVAHNAAFDLAFLGRELETAGVRWPVPALCTMRMLAAVQESRKTSLDAACLAVGIEVERTTHRAAEDAVLAARVFSVLAERLAALGVLTVADLAALVPNAVINGDVARLQAAEAMGVDGRERPTPRRELGKRGAGPTPRSSVTYRGALTNAIAGGGTVDLPHLRSLQGTEEPDVLAAIHAEVFGRWITAQAGSGAIGKAQREQIQGALRLLADLGWAPGQ